MNSTIDEFIYDMGWSNDKYYSKIVNGFYDKNNKKKYSNPTINYIFGGLNHAFANNKKYQEKKQEILSLVHKYFCFNFTFN